MEPKNLNREMSPSIHDHFPFPTQRPTQTAALTGVQKTFRESDKKFFILEGPTGFGKSGIGVAAGSWAKTLSQVGRYEPGSYVLSPQKTLTAQYMADFKEMGMEELKGQANYICHPGPEHEFDGMDCESAAALFEDEHRDCCTGYKPAKRDFMNSPLGVTNFDYYLNETVHAGQLKPRNLLVLDEGHNCENKILGFTDTEVTQKKCDKYDVPGRLPIFKAGDNAGVLNWLMGTYVPAVQVYLRDIDEKLARARANGMTEDKVRLVQEKNSTDKYLRRIGYFSNTDRPGDWFCWSDWDEKKRTGTGNLTIKPLTATLFADDILFRKSAKILIMSATILDFTTFMRNLGISRSDAEVMAVDSEFPLENRPIFYKPVGNMGYRTKQETMPKLAAMVEKILSHKNYGDKKGIVHTHSYEINRYLVAYLKSRGYGDRIVTHDNAKGARDAAVLEHMTDMSRATVLFSPSMTEGLDLKEDLSRFQILVKVPFPYLDPYVRARMQRDPAWYQWLTGLTLVQATGRSVRSKTDKAHTYILDSGFGDFISRNERNLPKWWIDSIIWPS
jgi:Rad3-related DNA helicase